MKKLITVTLLAIASCASAQWTNTTNQFFDTLHMPVSTAVQSQRNPIVINSFPDGGYFVIWEDDRNIATTKTDIYAQKYDQAGNRLWAADGVPVANGPNTQRYTFSSNQDYRNRSFAATDSAGGFYISYIDDSINNYSWERICVQHMRKNGIRVFGNAGLIIAQPTPVQSTTFSMPQLIPDGNKGFFIAYKITYGNEYIDVRNYRDENGTMKYYGGGRANENAVQRADIAPCGIRTYIEYPGTAVQDYNIWYDGQGGCNVIISMNGNTLGQYKMLCFNKIWKAKKDSKVKTFSRNSTGVTCPRITEYKKGDVYLLYSIKQDFHNVACGGSGSPLYEYTNYRLLSNGYYLIDDGGYDYNYPKGVTLSTPGDINVDLIAVTKRTYSNNTVSDFTVQGFAYSAEKYDSVPYQRASYSNPDFGYNTRSSQVDNLDFFRDTLLASGNYYPDFSFAGGGNEIYAAALMATSGDRLVHLQHLNLKKKSANAYALEYKTSSKFGEVIGKELGTGFGGSAISYDFPLVTVNNEGNALFYIREYYRSARVSPIVKGAELLWGAMGKPISTGVYTNSYYNLEQPFAALHPSNGTGLISWRDNKNIPGVTGDNIFMRHLDSLNEFFYHPPYKPVKLLPNPYSGTPANPAILLGTSKQYSTLEVYDSYGSDPGTSPVAEILDTYNLGTVEVSVLQNSSTIRKYNNQPYLDRNYTIKTEKNPTGAKINLRLFFTVTEFNALKAADNSIADPGDLVIIKQPNNTNTSPPVYTPIAGEQKIIPVEWKAVAGGYYVEIVVAGFGNFFIQKSSAIGLCAAGDATISSNVTGINYQWQVNTGGGFTNIPDNTNYSGTNTVNLQLNDIPSAWYGYEYRCIADGNTSYIVSLRFSNTWTGAANSAWENPSNWSCGVVPDANTDVIINSGAVGVNSNITCRSLTINPDVLFIINPGYKLTVTH